MSGTDGPSWEPPAQGQPWGPPPGGGSPPYPPPGPPPQYGPPPGAPPWAQSGYGSGPPPPQKTSGLAIAALVFGILWLCGVGSIGAIIFGIVALRQISRSEHALGGRGLAISGIVLGGIGLVLVPIMAAIAIPVFLNQRDIAWNAAVRSDLTTASTTQESYYADNGTYTTEVDQLEGHGFDASVGVDLTIARADSTSYCMEAKHESSDEIWHIEPDTGVPSSGPCDARARR